MDAQSSTTETAAGGSPAASGRRPRAARGAAARRRASQAHRHTLELMRAMWALDHALHRMSKRMAVTIGVTAPQRLVLRVLGEDSADTAGALARTLHLHPSTLTGVLQRLERDGLIVRKVEHADKRRSRLALTRRGEAVNARNSGTVEAAIADTLGRVAHADAEAAIRVLLAVTATLRQLSGRDARRQKPR
jgi:DNA-binding MarR family transcriptional regulator